jgi:hypothetical protein
MDDKLEIELAKVVEDSRIASISNEIKNIKKNKDV